MIYLLLQHVHQVELQFCLYSDHLHQSEMTNDLTRYSTDMLWLQNELMKPWQSGNSLSYVCMCIYIYETHITSERFRIYRSKIIHSFIGVKKAIFNDYLSSRYVETILIITYKIVNFISTSSIVEVVIPRQCVASLLRLLAQEWSLEQKHAFVQQLLTII